MTDPAMPRLLLLEDDPKLGPLIQQVLAERYLVTLVQDGSFGMRMALDGDFDVMIVDRRLPTLDGLSIVAELRRRGSTTPILVLTALGTLRDKVAGLDAGANDYLVKPFEFDELLARLRSIQRVFTSEGTAVSIGDWSFYPASHVIHSPYEGRVVLTDRETDLLRLFTDSPQRTFTREQILESVFSADDQPGTVDTYVHYLRRKTDAGIVLTMRGQGYRLGEL